MTRGFYLIIAMLVALSLGLVPATASANPPVQHLIISDSCGDPTGQMGRDRVGYGRVATGQAATRSQDELTWYEVTATISSAGDYTVRVVTEDCSLLAESTLTRDGNRLWTRFGIPGQRQPVRFLLLEGDTIVASTYGTVR